MDALDKLMEIENEIREEIDRLHVEVYSLSENSSERERLDRAYMFLQRTFWNVKRVQEMM